MKRFLSSLTIFIFVLMTQVLPALHRVYGCPCHPHVARAALHGHTLPVFTGEATAHLHQQKTSCSCHPSSPPRSETGLVNGDPCSICQLALVSKEPVPIDVGVINAPAQVWRVTTPARRLLCIGSVYGPTQPRAPPVHI